MEYWIATFKGDIVNPETQQSDMSLVSDVVLFTHLSDDQRKRLSELVMTAREAGNDVGYVWGEHPTSIHDRVKLETLARWRNKARTSN